MNPALFSLSAIVLSCALMAAPLHAEPAIQLASPVIELVPIVKTQSSSFGLNAEQMAKLDVWMKDTPAKRKTVEQEQIVLREKLRTAVLQSNNEEERKELITQIADNEAKLLTMRALCRFSAWYVDS